MKGHKGFCHYGVEGHIPCVCGLLLGATLYVTPTPDGGFTVTDPLDPKALTQVTPNGDGFIAIQPFNPRGLKIIEPSGDGYTIFSPFKESRE